jgi:hypothetical protein
MPDGSPKSKECLLLPFAGVTILVFPDSSKAVIIGLDDIIAEAYAEGRPVNRTTAGAILKKVAERNNVERSKRKWYQDHILDEYRKRCETGPIAEGVSIRPTISASADISILECLGSGF